jgi:putative membrane protein
MAPTTNNPPMNPIVLLNSIVYALLGVVIFVVVFFIVDLLTPYHLWQELVEKKNLALAVVLGCSALGICLIIAAAIH